MIFKKSFQKIQKVKKKKKLSEQVLLFYEVYIVGNVRTDIFYHIWLKKKKIMYKKKNTKKSI